MDSPQRKPRTIEFYCQSCGEELTSSTKRIGATVSCPKCDARNMVPDPTAVERVEHSEPVDTVKFYCPYCDQKLSSPVNFAGLEFECPNCSGSNIVPGERSKSATKNDGLIRFFCTSCGQKLSCDSELAGHTIDCPVCTHATTAPQRVGSRKPPARRRTGETTRVKAKRALRKHVKQEWAKSPERAPEASDQKTGEQDQPVRLTNPLDQAGRTILPKNRTKDGPRHRKGDPTEIGDLFRLTEIKSSENRPPQPTPDSSASSDLAAKVSRAMDDAGDLGDDEPFGAPLESGETEEAREMQKKWGSA